MKEIRILVVFTGGTIGSAPKGGALRPAGEKARRLLLTRFAEEKQKEFEAHFGRKIVFDTACPYEILSENLNGSHLERLEAFILQKGVGNYEGIVVTTGTDTLAYSSAAMGYAFADLQIPMVMVSANYPLSDERSNGFSNFEGALVLILSGGHKGVFCSYDNGCGHFIHYATRLLPQMNYSHLVESVMGKVYGRVEAMTVRVEKEALEPEGTEGAEQAEEPEGMTKEPEGMGEEQERIGKEAKQMGKEPGMLPLSCKNLSDKHPAFIRPYPGILYSAPKDCCGILLDTYHSGTLPVSGEAFRDFMKEAKKQKVLVFAAGVSEGLVYETVEQMREAGVIILPAASPAAMYMKLWMAVCEGGDAEKILFSPVGHDLII